MDTALDAAEPMDTDASAPPDIGDGGDSSGDASGYDARQATLERNTLRNLEFIDDSFAISSGSVDVDPNTYDWMKLYDVSDPSSIEVADVRIFQRKVIETTTFDGGVLVAVAEYATDEATLFDAAVEQTRIVDSNLVHYSVENGTLSKGTDYQRGEDDERPFTGYPRSFISNGERGILGTGEAWYAIGFEEDLAGIEYPAVKEQFERKIDEEGPRDPSLAGYFTSTLSDGLFVEIWHGVSVWSFDGSSGEAGLAGETIVEGALNQTDRAYAPANEHVYIPPRSWGGTGGTDSAYVFDVSDRQNPTLSATWEVGKDVMETEGFAQTFGFEVIGDRLYWVVSGRAAPQLRVFDISEPSTAEHLATWKWDELPLPSEHDPVDLGDLVSDGETLYIDYEANEPPELPAQTVVGVDPATLEP